MQINKKIFTTAFTALLLLSILAVAVPSYAFDATSTVVVTPAATGAAGSTVTVSGPAAGSPVGANPFGSVKVYWDNLGTLLNGTTFAAGDGSYSAKITIPSVAGGDHVIIVQDSLGTQASIPFTVTAALKTSVTPSTGTTTYALPLEAVTLTGSGFAASTLTTITFNGGTFTPITATTNVNGTFTAVMTVPTDTVLSAVPYTVTATQAGPVTATAAINVNYYLTVTPSGLTAPVPPGVTVTFGGKITASKAFSIAIDTVPVASGTSDGNGRITATYALPALIAAAVHSVTITAGTLVVPPAQLITGATPTATLSAASGVAGLLVTVTLANFDASTNVTLSVGSTVVNSTATDYRFGPTATDGSLVAEFSVPAITPGAYAVTVADVYGASATVVGGFTVLAAPVTTITTASSYLQGNTISFSITTTETSLTAGPIVTIKDPTGATWFASGTWPLTGTAVKTVLFQDQLVNGLYMVLPANAPLGSWNWTVTYTPTSTAVATKATGLFTVDAVGATGGVTNAQLNSTLTTINSNVNSLTTNLNSLTTSVAALDGKITSINGNIATITTGMNSVTGGMTSVTASVNSLSASISSISSGVATIQTSLGTVTTSLNSIDAVLGAVAGDTATLKTSVGTITTSLASIGTQVTSINGNVATIQTDLGTLKGTVTSVSGNVANIQTSLGTMQADISTLQSNVTSVKDSTGSLSTLIIVAIVLALLAAIAAIASIVLMRRKIAG
jgi:trimeric autotransporter adhesin